MFERIANLTWGHPKAVLAAAAAFTVAAFALSNGVEAHLKAAGFSDPATDSKRAQELMIDRAGADSAPGLVLRVRPRSGGAPLPLRSAVLQAETRRLAAAMRSIAGIARVDNPLRGGPQVLIAKDRSSFLLLGYFSSGDVDVLATAAEDAARRLTSSRFEVTVGGLGAGFNEMNEAVRSDLIRAELIAFPVLALLLLIVFRGVVAAAIPLMLGVVSVGGTFLVLRTMSEFVDTSVFALNISTAMGLGLAVDYGLLLVSRYREELERNGPTRESHRRLVESAGRTVLFSGLTVAVAMAALTMLPQRFLYSVGAGGAIVSVFAALGALFLVPSLLALLGERVNALSLRRGPAVSDESGGWYRLARGVMRRPVGVALASSALLLALAFPVLGVTLTIPGANAVPEGASSRDVVLTMDRDYPAALGTPVSVTVDGAVGGPRLRRLEARIGAIPGIDSPARFRRLAPDLAVANFGLEGRADGTLSDEAQRAVREIRALDAPAPLLVAGYTAEFLDLKTSLARNLPVVVALIALSTLALLFLLTGSIVLPLKTLLMNLLTLAATLGVIVAAFQWGLLDGPLGYSGPESMETTTLVLMFAVIFGLCTDYAVLVLARVKELHDSGLSNEEAVAVGIARTGRVISAAALCLAAVFLAFTTSSIFFMKEAGVGYAAAVLIDATIVRALLVPALMRLFGEWNWWAPAPLCAACSAASASPRPPDGTSAPTVTGFGIASSPCHSRPSRRPSSRC
ncbi:MAG TPA: MMPL family transporter [Solirubrobacterales bacterium]|nr:MMPL family transporter [Solirubrobacterales bacterium]